MNISLAKVASIIHGELAKMLVKIHKAVNISARLSLRQTKLSLAGEIVLFTPKKFI
jgi:hypothetical protein